MDIRKALEHYDAMFEDAFKKSDLFEQLPRKYARVVFYGMGASAIAPLILSKWFDGVQVANSHRFKGKINARTFRIAVSYSGNTEEVLFNVEKHGVDYVVSSGGRLLELKNVIKYEITKGIPPRAAFPYLFVGSLTGLRIAGLISEEEYEKIKNTILSFDCEHIKEKAKEVADFLKNKEFAYVLSDDADAYLAYRFKTQLNENAKMFAFHEVLPEANHNSLMALEDKQVKDKAGFVFFDSADSFVRFSQDYWKKQLSDYMSFENISNGKYERFIYLLCLGDWASYYLSELRGVDASETSIIEGLKNERRQSKL